jgi:hypothetical protein
MYQNGKLKKSHTTCNRNPAFHIYRHVIDLVFNVIEPLSGAVPRDAQSEFLTTCAFARQLPAAEQVGLGSHGAASLVGGI